MNCPTCGASFSLLERLGGALFCKKCSNQSLEEMQNRPVELSIQEARMAKRIVSGAQHSFLLLGAFHIFNVVSSTAGWPYEIKEFRFLSFLTRQIQFPFDSLTDFLVVSALVVCWYFSRKGNKWPFVCGVIILLPTAFASFLVLDFFHSWLSLVCGFSYIKAIIHYSEITNYRLEARSGQGRTRR